MSGLWTKSGGEAVKILDMENIKIPSVNQKYILSHGRLVLNDEYRQFKDDMALCCKKVKISPPYVVFIEIESYKDIDNSIKPILDSLKMAEVITDDKEVYGLSVRKKTRKRGKAEALRVFVDQCIEI